MVYIREAHPVDGWWFGDRLVSKLIRRFAPDTSFDTYDPKTVQERRLVASQCEETLQYGIPTVVDEIDDRTNQSYAALPTRLYLVGLDGKVEYEGGLGPYGFKPAQLKQAIVDYLAAAG